MRQTEIQRLRFSVTRISFVLLGNVARVYRIIHMSWENKKIEIKLEVSLVPKLHLRNYNQIFGILKISLNSDFSARLIRLIEFSSSSQPASFFRSIILQDVFNS